MMEQPAPQGWIYLFGPGIVAASSFAVADVLVKVALNDGADVLTLSTFRGLFSIAMMLIWLRLIPRPQPHTPRQRWIALGVGVLFAGIIFGLFQAIELVTVPVAVLSYFVYPLVTGIVAALIGMERLGWRGLAAAVAAFIGLALTVGAQPGGVALAGVAFAFGAAVCRVTTLLIVRATLHEADTRLTTWYTMLSSGVIFAAISLLAWHWQGPQHLSGWLAMVALSAASVISVIALFVSIKRIGPFRSALTMNLEPLMATAMSALFLGEIITPIQALGGMIMLAALVAFQMRR